MALLKLALRNLQRNRRRTAITLVALVVGVAVMVTIRGFINSQQKMILENLVEGRMGAVQVHRAGYAENVLSNPLTLDFEDTVELRAKIASVRGVVAVAPRIEFGAMLSTPDKVPPPEDGSALPEEAQGKTSFFIATAIDPTIERVVTPRRVAWIQQGAYVSDRSAPEVVLNNEFSRGLEVSVHPQGAPLPPVEKMTALLAADRDGSLNGENVVVSGTFAAGAPGDRRVGLVSLEVAQRILRMENRVTEYALRVEPLKDAVRVKQEVSALLNRDYEVQTYQDLFPFVVELIGTQEFIFGIVSFVFLLIVLLGIVNAMLMSVLERVREIGTMLAVGMRRKQIVQLFVLEGMTLGLIGGFVGIVLGWLMTQWLHHRGIALAAPGAAVESIARPTVTMGYLAQALAQAIVGSSLAALWPALRASGLRPVEALQST